MLPNFLGNGNATPKNLQGSAKIYYKENLAVKFFNIAAGIIQ